MTFADKLSALLTSIGNRNSSVNTQLTAAQQVAVAAIPASEKGVTVATLVNGKVPAEQMASYVDDILEYDEFAQFPSVGERGKIYFDLSATVNGSYRWTGSQYLSVGNHVSLSDASMKLATIRTIAMTGDGSWSVNFDGQGNVSALMTLTDVVVAGTGIKITYNSKGQVTSSAALSAADIPNLNWAKITSGKPTTRDGYGITDVPLSANSVLTGQTKHDNGTVAAPAITFTNSLGMGLYRINNLTLGFAVNGVKQASLDSNGNFIAVGNIGIPSDERLKKNWRDLPEDFLEQLVTTVKYGIYDRTDIDLTQAGISAQDMQKLLPSVVGSDRDEMLSVAYGNAAMVTAMKLAETVLVLQERVKDLEMLVGKKQ